MKQRPIFRAIDSSQNVAFVPHTQLDGMRTDALVIECKLWGLFRCQPAGRVAALVPGEFVSVDPCSRLSVAASWGSAGNTGWYRASPTA